MSAAPVEKYLPCKACASERAAGELFAARNCRSCKGTGMVRNPDSFVCNRCGEPMFIKPDWGPHGLIEARVSGGYASPHLLDLVRYTFSFCEKCLRQLFDECKVPPTVQDHHEGSISYAQERARYARWKWRQAGGHIDKLKTGLCNATIECEATAVWRVFNSGSMNDDVCCEQHKEFFRYANSFYVPAAAVAGLISGHRPTQAHAKQIASAFLSVAARPGASATYFKYAPHCIGDAAEIDWRSNPHALDGYSAIWIPAPGLVMDLGDLLMIQSILLPDGQLLVGPLDDIERFAHLPGVQAAAVLPQLEEELSEPPATASS